MEREKEDNDGTNTDTIEELPTDEDGVVLELNSDDIPDDDTEAYNQVRRAHRPVKTTNQQPDGNTVIIDAGIRFIY